jgi:hypothetical protein
MLSIATGSYLAYKREVDYKELNKSVTFAIYHWSGMQGASTINPKSKHYTYTYD